MLLLLSILVPLGAGAAIALSPRSMARTIALVGALAQAAVILFAAFQFNWGDGGAFQLSTEEPIQWLPQMGLTLSVGVDSVALLLLLLTGLLGPICVLASTSSITTRRRTYYGALMVLQAAMAGIFVARDLILFYACFEFTLAPMFVLISLFGSTNRRRAAIKFFLYTFTGSVIALAGLVYVAWFHARTHASGAWSFDIATLITSANALTPQEQKWVMIAMLLGFAVKVPLFPFHTWLPLAHTEAPTAGSVLLAGVLLKLGTYGIYRFVFPIAPEALLMYAPYIAGVCIIGIIYGGLICWVQTDVKKLVAYSSVAHLGFCVLGMAALNHNGIMGSVLYMINHGLSTGALFLLIGMVYERYHTRSMKELGGLASKMPLWSTFMVFFVMSSVGLPGLNGFTGEFLCLLGTFQADSSWGGTEGVAVWASENTGVPGMTYGNLGPWFALVAGTGMIIAAMYLLYMTGKVVWGKLRLPPGHDAHGHGSHGSHAAAASDHASHLPTDLNTREIITLAPLAVLCLVLGVYPKPMMQAIEPSVEATVRYIETARAKSPLPQRPFIPINIDPADPAHTSPAHMDPAHAPQQPASSEVAAASAHEEITQ